MSKSLARRPPVPGAQKSRPASAVSLRENTDAGRGGAFGEMVELVDTVA